jgi:hypothetical protein
MTEQDLVKKVEELMNLLDQVKMYKKALARALKHYHTYPI